MARYSRRLIPGVLLVALGILACSARAWQVWALRHHPLGRYSMEQALARAEPLCRALAPRAGTLHMVPIPVRIHDKTGRMRQFWVVTCSDDRDRYAALTIWDSDNGDLILASRPDPHPLWGERNALSRREAGRIAARWLRTLGLAVPAARWRLARPPLYCNDTWRFYLRAGDREAVLGIYALSGELVVARSVRAG